VDFAGWLMPVQYKTGLLAEHHAVRNSAGIFDVSHMGQLEFRGPDAVGMVDRLITNDFGSSPEGKALYTVICNDQGTILDDAIAYKLAADHVMMVVNASNVDKIAAWVSERATGDAQYRNVSDDWSLIAVQGPRAMTIVDGVLPGAKAMGFFDVREFDGRIVATTGYTGEDGCEIFVPNAQAPELWRSLLKNGAAFGLVPCGLGARDTLRLEAKLSLYGNDIDETTNPIEAGLGWTVKLKKSSDFIGRDALLAIKKAKTTRRLVGLQVTGRGIARHGYPLLAADGSAVGVVTSGTRSPTLELAIGLGYVDKPHHAVGTALFVAIRGRRIAAEVVKTPFYKRDS
jgi:aminomethyltransferase